VPRLIPKSQKASSSALAGMPACRTTPCGHTSRLSALRPMSDLDRVLPPPRTVRPHPSCEQSRSRLGADSERTLIGKSTVSKTTSLTARIARRIRKSITDILAMLALFVQVLACVENLLTTRKLRCITNNTCSRQSRCRTRQESRFANLDSAHPRTSTST